jgi:nucleoside-diphosphate-sugar epimerase
MPRVLITGATGFIGCRLSELWQLAGRSVRGIGMVRNDVETKRADALRQAGVELIVGDLADKSDTKEVLADVDTVIHLAAAQHEANVGEDYFLKVNVDATKDLLTQCEKHDVKRFFYASSIGVYGVSDHGEISENTPLRPDNRYGRSKVAAEAMLSQYEGDIALYIGRIGETYGPWDMRLHKLYAGIKKGRFWLVGSGDNFHQPIYVDDLAAAIEIMLGSTEAIGKPVNLCGDRAITTRDMCNGIAASLGANLYRLRIPMLPLLVTAVGMEMTLGKVGIQPPLHRRRLDFFRKSLRFNTQLRDGLLELPAQVSFDDGARETAKWYLENHWL